MYVVDLWTVKEWYATTDGKWKGIVCGEKHMFKIWLYICFPFLQSGGQFPDCPPRAISSILLSTR